MTDFSEPTTAHGSAWFRVYSPDGYQMAVTLPITSVADALRHLEDIRAAGLTAQLPVAGGLESGEKADTITTVVRREKENKHGHVVSVIDCYWESAKHAFTAIYLDEPEQIAEFERQSGLKVKDLPLYESDAPKQLEPGKPSKFERKCTPFVAIKAENGMKNVVGRDQMTYKFVRYGTLVGAPPLPPQVNTPPAPQPAPAPTATPSPDDFPEDRTFTDDEARQFAIDWKAAGVSSYKDICAAMNVSDIRYWTKGKAEAHAAVSNWLKAKGSAPTGASPLAANARHRP